MEDRFEIMDGIHQELDDVGREIGPTIFYWIIYDKIKDKQICEEFRDLELAKSVCDELNNFDQEIKLLQNGLEHFCEDCVHEFEYRI